MSRKAKRRTSAALKVARLVSCLAILVVGIGLQTFAGGYEMAKRLRQNVIFLVVDWGEGGYTYGFGFVVGEQNGRLSIVTARHVLESTNPDHDKPVISARIFGQAAHGIPATILMLATDFDLGLLEIESPSGYTWETECYDTEVPEGGTEVWYVGRNQDWFIPNPGKPGSIQSIDASGAHLSAFIDTVLPGTSGAPLISEWGIVGMICTDTGAEVDVLSIGVIRDILSSWATPWGLVECSDYEAGSVVPQGVGAEISGRVMYDGEPVSNVTLSDAVDVHLLDAESGDEIYAPYAYDQPSSSYVFRDVPPGTYVLQLCIDSGNPLGIFSAGDYDGSLPGWGWGDGVTVPPGVDEVEQDFRVAQSIHLLEPIDNQEPRLPTTDDVDMLRVQTELHPTPLGFVWYPVPRAWYYLVAIALVNGTTGEELDRSVERVTTRSFEPSPPLADSDDGNYYVFSMAAYNFRNELVGYFRDYYSGGDTTGYAFRLKTGTIQGGISTPMSEDITQPDWTTVVSWQDAAEHVGEVIAVQGPVVTTGHDSDGLTDLDLADDWLDPNRFRIYIPSECLAAITAWWGEDPLNFYDRTIQVYGKIELEREEGGRATITLCNPSFIRFINE